MRVGSKTFDPDDFDTTQLARLLGRTPASVVMRMQNFRSLTRTDGAHDLRGLSHGSDLCSAVVNRWRGNLSGLRECADLIDRELRGAVADLFDHAASVEDLAFPDHELYDKIGAGAFATVYSCILRASGEKRAIKVLSGLGERDAVERFARELRALRAVRHPNIIRVFDDNLSREHMFPAIILEFAEYSLADHLHARGRDLRPALPKTEAIAIILAITQAVLELHRQTRPIVHRDINPANILRLPDGRWVLADFSLAKFLPDATPRTLVTSTDYGAGTSYYASPEQMRSLRSADERSDVYALGILIWELFTEAYHPIDSHNLGLSAQLEEIVQRATSREKSSRYQSVGELHEAFQGAS
jgi:serine/threonine protein kinase